LWALPIFVLLCHSEKEDTKHGRRHKTPAQRLFQALLVLRRWFPDRGFLLAADGGFASHEMTSGIARRVAHTTYVSRFYAQAALYDPPPVVVLKAHGKRPTAGRSRVKGDKRDTPAQVVAKRNALEALRETTQAALYPCSLTSVGTTLITSGLLGAVVGGTLLAIAGPLCASYYTMILAEINTIKDPPRSDFRTVARDAPVALGAGTGCGGRHGAALRLCKTAGLAASRLLARSRATARLARAVETTIDRESGAERAHSKSSAERQNRALILLSEQFRKARRAQTAAGAALARIIRSHGATVRMTAAQASAADQDLLSALSQRGLSAANRTFLAGLLKGRAFDVLGTLGR